MCVSASAIPRCQIQPNLAAASSPHTLLLIHCDVVPTIWHWAAGNVCDPFNIDEYDLVKKLAVIWRHVYADKVPFKIPPTVSLVRKVLPFL